MPPVTVLSPYRVARESRFPACASPRTFTTGRARARPRCVPSAASAPGLPRLRSRGRRPGRARRFICRPHLGLPHRNRLVIAFQGPGGPRPGPTSPARSPASTSRATARCSVDRLGAGGPPAFAAAASSRCTATTLPRPRTPAAAGPAGDLETLAGLTAQAFTRAGPDSAISTPCARKPPVRQLPAGPDQGRGLHRAKTYLISE